MYSWQDKKSEIERYVLQNSKTFVKWVARERRELASGATNNDDKVGAGDDDDVGGIIGLEGSEEAVP